VEAAADIRAFYARRRVDLETRQSVVAGRLRRVGQARLIMFLLAVVSVGFVLRGGSDSVVWAQVLGAVGTAAFIALVARSRIIQRERRRVDELLTMNSEATARLARNWSALPPRSWDLPDPTHPYSSDLDVRGEGSLMQLFPTLSRTPGDTTLASWLLHPSAPDVAAERQVAVREMIPLVDVRESLELLGRRARVAPASLHGLLDWANGAVAEPRDRYLRLVALVVSAATVGAMLAQFTGAVAGPLWLIPIGIGAIISSRWGGDIARTFADLRGHAPLLRTYDAMMALIESRRFDAPLLQRLQRDLGEQDERARTAVRSLARLADSADVRHSPMLHAIVNVLLLWDLQVASRLRRWQAVHGANVSRWLDAIGAIEALSALAALAHDNPTWTFPELASRDIDCVEASDLGHPLLAPEACVGNDVSVGPRGTLLLISGSNMSGKSTLLRAIGLNVVLAQAGSVVCASSMRCPRLGVHTSMRVEDSLRQGVSRFMAELLRIKSIVDAAETASNAGGPPVLYLLDELLQGTNSVERAIAAQRVVERLLDFGAIGVVTTHDLALLDTETLTSRVHHAHFRETVVANDANHPAMSFDYVLRPGKATSRNALALLELLGVTDAADDASD
jgi:hypothetical protein